MYIHVYDVLYVYICIVKLKTQAVYKCDEGYYLTDGDLIRNCTEWGKWSGKHPVCSSKLYFFK